MGAGATSVGIIASSRLTSQRGEISPDGQAQFGLILGSGVGALTVIVFILFLMHLVKRRKELRERAYEMSDDDSVAMETGMQTKAYLPPPAYQDAKPSDEAEQGKYGPQPDLCKDYDKQFQFDCPLDYPPAYEDLPKVSLPSTKRPAN